MRHINFLIKASFITITSISICSCVVKPKKTSHYNAECDVITKKYELTVEQVKMFDDMNCENDDCKMQFTKEIAGSVIMVPLSAVVSSSIAIVGNTLYWLEKQGKCN